MPIEALRGAITASYGVDPTVGIAVDLAADRHWTQPVQLIAWVALAVTGARRQSLDMRASDDRFVYEPAQRVLSTAATGEVRIARWDPQTQTFAPPTVVEATGDTRIVPIDPARSGGIAAIVVERRADDDTRVGELSAAELAPAASVRPRTTYAVHGEVRAIDRTGRLYVHDPAHANDLAIYEHGKPGARLVGVGARQLRPSPDGARVAVIGDGAIAVLDRAGVERWTAPVRDGDTVAWLGGGELAIAYPTGIEVRAADTGAVTARRCGWAFGLHDQPPALHTRGNDLGSLCDRPPARR